MLASEFLERTVFFRQPAVDEVAFEVGEFSLEKAPIAADVGSVGCGEGAVDISHVSPRIRARSGKGLMPVSNVEPRFRPFKRRRTSIGLERMLAT